MARPLSAEKHAAVLSALSIGKPVKMVAAELGVSISYVTRIARRNGLSRPVGRPEGLIEWRDCPAHLLDDYRHLTRSKGLRVAEARKVLEAYA